MPAGHRCATSTRESIKQMSIKCQGLVEGSFSRNSESGRMEAASIATAILFVGTPRILATWLCAAGVRLSAAITAAISCPSSPQAHARVGINKTTKRNLGISTDGIEGSTSTSGLTGRGGSTKSVATGTRQTTYRYAPAALAEIIAVKPVGQITERNSGHGISPSDLPAEARVAERFGRVRAPETA